MITTPDHARRIIAKLYGKEFKYRITSRSATIGVRPIAEVNAGKPTLVWHRLAAGQDSAVRIGVLVPGNTIDWSWTPETVTAKQA